MKNLEQIRAAHAAQQVDAVKNREGNESDGGDALSGYPSLIINNGLLATLAFSIEKQASQNYRVANAIAFHLANLPSPLAPNVENAQALLTALHGSDAIHLRRCTDETLRFLAFLKRFVRASK